LPVRGSGAPLALPFADTEAMQLHLDEIAANVAPGAHAVLIFDRAGWHTTPNLVFPPNLTPIWLPSRAPELNPVENVWQYLRANWLSNIVFETFDDIIDAAYDAWRNLTARPDVITSIGMRRWASSLSSPRPSKPGAFSRPSAKIPASACDPRHRPLAVPAPRAKAVP
jgi:hypothetical protein